MYRILYEKRSNKTRLFVGYRNNRGRMTVRFYLFLIFSMSQIWRVQKTDFAVDLRNATGKRPVQSHGEERETRRDGETELPD